MKSTFCACIRSSPIPITNQSDSGKTSKPH